MDVSYNHFTINLFQKPPLSLSEFFVVVTTYRPFTSTLFAVADISATMTYYKFKRVQLLLLTSAVEFSVDCWYEHNIYDYVTHISIVTHYIQKFI